MKNKAYITATEPVTARDCAKASIFRDVPKCESTKKVGDVERWLNELEYAVNSVEGESAQLEKELSTVLAQSDCEVNDPDLAPDSPIAHLADRLRTISRRVRSSANAISGIRARIAL